MAAERHPIRHTHIVVRRGEPLIGVFAPDEQDAETVTYFTDEDEADQVVTDAAAQAALALAGAWADLSWEEIEAGLDRIRHESEPTPPLEL